jgi:ethanolamine transporter EutH
MSTASQGGQVRLQSVSSTGPGEWVRKALLACGALSGLVYIGWNELAALQWAGYSRVSNAISELHLTGSSLKWLLDPWGIVYNALLLAFGIGVWRSARSSRALQVVGGLQILAGATLPLWMLFGEASLAAHVRLSVIGISTMLGSMAFSAVAFRGWFRLYSLISVAAVVTLFGLALSYVPEVNAGHPTPFLGLDERIAVGAYFLWLFVLVALLWRRRANTSGE